jgi:hypothetical protein
MSLSLAAKEYTPGELRFERHESVMAGWDLCADGQEFA